MATITINDDVAVFYLSHFHRVKCFGEEYLWIRISANGMTTIVRTLMWWWMFYEINFAFTLYISQSKDKALWIPEFLSTNYTHIRTKFLNKFHYIRSDDDAIRNCNIIVGFSFCFNPKPFQHTVLWMYSIDVI